jgi:titin
VRCTTPPESPGNVTAAASGAQSIDVKWIDRSGAEDGFEIQRSIDGSSFIVAATVPANATTHRDAGLTTGTRYYYRARATKDGGFSNYSITVTGLAIGAAPVSSPAINATANGSTGVVVYWTTTIANAEGYRAERSLNGGATWELAGTTNAFQTYIGDGDRTPEQSVCYRVFAFNGIGDAPASNVDCVTPPARVSDLTATPGGDGSIDLRWTDPSAVNTGYVVEYLETSYGYYYYYYPQQYWVQIATIGDVTSHRVSGLSWDLFHEFRVTALVAKGSGDPSNQVGSYTELPPQAPSNLTASVLSSSRIDLAWMDNSAGETYFTVERCEGTVATCANGFFWYVTLDADATGYSDNGVAPGKTYTYRIVAWKGAVPSVPSGTATVSVPAAQPE